MARKWIVRLLVVAIVGVALFYGAILLWTKVINPPEERLGTEDLEQVLTADDSLPTEATTPVATAPDDTVSATSTTPSIEPASPDGGWSVASDSIIGYRVKEVLSGVDTEGVGRSNGVTGSLVIDGTKVLSAEFEVDVASIESDQAMRDNQFRGRIMDVANHPLATFVLTAPIDLGAEPAIGQRIEVTAVGDLTLRGTTRTVEFPLTAEFDGRRIAVLGNIEVVFADYGISNPSNQFVTTGDTGLLEFVLAFDRAT